MIPHSYNDPPRPRSASHPQKRPKLLITDVKPVAHKTHLSHWFFTHISPWEAPPIEYEWRYHALVLAGLVAMSGLLCLWYGWAGYGLVVVSIIIAVVLRLSHRFLFLGMIFVLSELIVMVLLKQMIASRQLATLFFWIFAISLFYLLCETVSRRFQPKDKITTSRSIKHNPVFKRALVRKYQKRPPNSFPKA